MNIKSYYISHIRIPHSNLFHPEPPLHVIASRYGLGHQDDPLLPCCDHSAELIPQLPEQLASISCFVFMTRCSKPSRVDKILSVIGTEQGVLGLLSDIRRGELTCLLRFWLNWSALLIQVAAEIKC